MHHVNVGLARTIHTGCIYAVFGREITKYTVIYGACIYGSGQCYMYVPLAWASEVPAMGVLRPRNHVMLWDVVKRLSALGTFSWGFG